MAVADRAMPEYFASGTSVTQAKRKITVNPTSRMWSAISLGVFCRAAPSTSRIMRSRKDSPGSTAMRTTMRSDSTLVPPVTADRSPPLSRITGADSPVMADSSTDAMPSMISPSPGTSCPASTTTRSPLRKADEGTDSSLAVLLLLSGLPPLPFSKRRAVVSLRILRRVSACAFPRPSATASAKLAKITVNHSQRLTAAVNHSGVTLLAGPRAMSRNMSKVVRTLPTSTTNITGFLATCRGASLRKLSPTARRTIGPSKRETACALGANMARTPFRGEPGSARPPGRAREQGRRSGRRRSR